MTGSTVLKQVLPSLTQEDIGTLMEHVQRRSYPAGVCLCREGEVEQTFYVLEQGRVEIFVQISPDEKLTIKELGPGDSFGEMALVADQPRSATVCTLSNCHLLEIGKQALETVLEHSPHLALTLMRRVSRNLWDNDRRTIEAMQRKNKVLARAYADLEAQEKLRTEFITTLSHELRTPLTAAQGYLHLINADAIPEVMMAKTLATVTRRVEQVVAITNSLIVLHEIDLISPRIAPVHLPPLVRSVILEVAPHHHQPSTAVVNQVPDDFPQVWADAAGLGLALRALVDNAVKFSPQGSPVTITARMEDQEVVILVTDRGVGMSAETQARVFEPYFKVQGPSADRLFDGLGIGLAVARFIVERHGGDIRLTSALGQGSTFSIRLPAARPKE